MMNLKILGTGGFNNSGIPFNAFVIDDRYLFETPPDILQSLHREGISPGNIESLYISHVHGDHIFGIPFLIFNIWKDAEKSGKRLRIIGGKEIQSKVLELCAAAIRADHPYMNWLTSACSFETVDDSSALPPVTIGKYTLRFMKTVHEAETYGVRVSDGPRIKLQYIADTMWDDSIGRYFAEPCDCILCDVNGAPGNNKIHMSAEDVLANGIPLCGPDTLILGTHVSGAKSSSDKRLRIAQPGDQFTL